jgi:penicillin amidase
MWVVLGLVGMVAAAAAGLWFYLRASLPQLDGARRLEGLSAPVTVERDALGVPTIRAANRLDAARALGFLHGQDRFFQMDVARRMAAGELAELFGGGAPVLDADRRFRLHRLRAVAGEVVRGLPPEHEQLTRAYVAGVNAGLASLKAAPPEYLLLRASPKAWSAEDSVLVVYSMFFGLQDATASNERSLAVLRQALPAAAFDFFVPKGTDWDASLEGGFLPTAPIPGPEEFSLRNQSAKSDLSDKSEVSDSGVNSAKWGVSGPKLAPGSNCWAVDGSISSSGAALVANDMHLGLSLPNTWYRVRMICPGADPSQPGLDVTGVTLPGVGAIVVGSNGFIAWAFTNAMLDTADIILLELAPDRPGLYRTPDGWKAFENHTEVLRVRGGKDVTMQIESTIWGPVLPASRPGPKQALRWVAHLPEAVNLNILGLETTRDTDSALALAPRCGIPVQNLVVGDRYGKIGWTLMGRLPRRVGFDGRLPVSWADGRHRWDGLVSPEDYPKVVAPASGRLWTANNRVSDSAAYMQLGPWLEDGGARARQIRDGLFALKSATPADFLALQLDERALFLARWQKLLLATLAWPAWSARPEIRQLRELAADWGARAAPASAGYRLVREWRERVVELIFEPVHERCRRIDPVFSYISGIGLLAPRPPEGSRRIDPDFSYGSPSQEMPVWTLLQARPAHLLNPRFADYEALLRAAVEEVLAKHRQANEPLRQATWGARNRVAIRHHLSVGLPWLSRWLDIPAVELPGDRDMPRVQGPQHGASERLAVSPGHEAEGLFHMPGGQSGHFLSPYYRAGHQAWQEGKPAPFLPGPSQHRLTLHPLNQGA